MPPSLLPALSDDLARLVAGAAPALVAVHSHRSRSTGFAWRPGLVVTADEALAEDGEVRVALPGGEVVPAVVAGRDPSTDVALLRVEGAVAPAELGGAPAPRPGEIAVVAGAGDEGPSAALGVVALAGGTWRSMRGGEIDARIELDLRLRPSAEGGLALDAEGRAWGMAVAGPRGRTLVIPAATIDRVAARLETHGRLARGYLGLGLQPVRAEGGSEEAGLMVISVDEGGPGARAGLRQGDVVLSWNNEPARSLRALLRWLGPDSVGAALALRLRRGGEPLDLTLVVGERPA